jgi:hypothetical protein
MKVELNSPAAGSLFVLNPRLILGTNCCACSHALTFRYPPPKLKLCVPFCQVRLSSRLIVGADRQLRLFSACQLVRPMLPSKSIAKPPWSTKFWGPFVDTSPKLEEPPSAVSPPRSSLTKFWVSVDRNDPV